jgi:hypothetical protein
VSVPQQNPGNTQSQRSKKNALTNIGASVRQ